MSDREELKAMATMFRECADVIDEIVECEAEERQEELFGKLMVKLIKLEAMKE